MGNTFREVQQRLSSGQSHDVPGSQAGTEVCRKGRALTGWQGAVACSKHPGSPCHLQRGQDTELTIPPFYDPTCSMAASDDGPLLLMGTARGQQPWIHYRARAPASAPIQQVCSQVASVSQDHTTIPLLCWPAVRAWGCPTEDIRRRGWLWARSLPQYQFHTALP